jgi:hypothetical protein
VGIRKPHKRNTALAGAVFASGSATTGSANMRVLVAIDGDMKQLAKRFGISSGSERFKRLSILRLCCNEVLAAKRLQQAMTLIEHEWNISKEKAARRLWVDIGPHFLRSNR